MRCIRARKLAVLTIVSLFLLSIYTPVFIFSQPSNNYVTNLLIINGKIQTRINHTPQKQEQPPWMTEWSYRKLHTIVGSTAGAQSNYQMKITVHYGVGIDNGENVYCDSKCRTDFGDIRFTKFDGTTLLDYWLEDKIDGDKAIFWVEIDSIPVSPSKVDIYIYYGKQDAATTSNGDKTFIFFDDFSGGTLDINKWTREKDGSGTVSVSNGVLSVTVGANWDLAGVYSTKKTIGQCIIETKCKGTLDGGDGSVEAPCLELNDKPSIKSTINYMDKNEWRGTHFIEENYQFPNHYASVSYYYTAQPTSYKIFQIIKNGNNFLGQYLEADYSFIADSIAHEISDFPFYLILKVHSKSGADYDWARIRSYCSPEPSHGDWGIEELNWLPGWNYRKSHTIVGSTEGAQTDYQMRITVYYGSGTDDGENIYCNGHCKTDFGDVRFTKSDGTTLLDYWMEEKTDGDKAIFWVEIDSIPASPDSTDIYVYYGKSDATTTSNGDNTFPFYDHFDDGSIDTDKWNNWLQNGETTESGTELTVTGGDNAWEVIGAKIQFSYPRAFHMRAKFSNTQDVQMGADDRSATGSWIGSGYDNAFFDRGGAVAYTTSREGSVGWTTRTSTLTSYKHLYITWESGEVKFYEDGSLKCTRTSTIPLDNMGFQFGAKNTNSMVTVDWCFVKEWCDPEPSHGSWRSQEQVPEIWNDTVIIDTQIVNNRTIILNGNLTIASGGSLTLTDITLWINCTAQGSNCIEVQSGGALYINDTDGNPNTKNDATIIRTTNAGYRFLFWVRAGATFQMNNSGLYCCGYNDPNIDYDIYDYGLWINTNNTVVENNTFSNNYCGIVLQNSYHNTIRNNNATYNYIGFYLFSSSNNELADNTAANNGWCGFKLEAGSDNNNITGNTATNNDDGFYLIWGSNNLILGNNATDNIYDGFYLYSSVDKECSNNLLSGNIASNNSYGFHEFCGSANIVANKYIGDIAVNNTNGFYISYSYSPHPSNDLTGSILANYLRVEVLGQTGGAVRGADVKIEVDGGTFYASLGFGGSNSTTDQNGLTDWIIVPYQTYISGNWVNNTTSLTVNSFAINITNSPRIVDMSSSHKETFFAELVDTSITTSIGAGTNQHVNASAEMGIELSMNVTAPVTLSIIKPVGNPGGSAPFRLSFLKFVSIQTNYTPAVQGITITIHYTDQEATGNNLNETSLAIWYWNETSGKWAQLPSIVDTQNNIVTAYSEHLTHFAILGTPIPTGIPVSSYLPFLLLLLTPSGLNPLIYLALGLVAVALVTVAALGLRRRREAEVPEREMVLVRQTPTSWKPKREMVPVRQTPITRRPQCVYCGCELSENANFCPLCGKSIAICSVCNRDILSGEVFVECPHCHVPSHRDHLLEWIKVKGYCPNCKERLSRLDVI